MTKHYVMCIDLQLCIGCNTCTVACKQENNLPNGVSWTRIVSLKGGGDDTSFGEYPNLILDHLPLACQQCENCPCIEICPSTATYKRTEDGLILQDPSQCIGCRYCMIVCPYTSVRVYSSENLKYSIRYATGNNPLIHRSKTVEKCTFCAHRLAKGLIPACVESCALSARIFGDLNDPESEVTRVLRTRPYFQLLVEKGTRPSVYYLV